MRSLIPKGATMRMRMRGRYVYAVNTTPISWATELPEAGTEVWCVSWRNSQSRLMAERKYVQKGTK